MFFFLIKLLFLSKIIIIVVFIMFRLPVLAGAAGALGATYCSPYLAVDGAYHTRPSGQTSALGSSRLVP